MEIDVAQWARTFNVTNVHYDKEAAGSEESRRVWDEKAPSFARKPTRSDYINQFIALLASDPVETIFDMGCGSGTIAIPLAKAGHAVCAVDFSEGMLSELRRAAEKEGVPIVDGATFSENGVDTTQALDELVEAGTILTFQRSWQEPWEDLPTADVCLSSRSLVTADILDALDKMESHATKRVVITTGAGDLPFKDSRIYEAMGREKPDTMPPDQLVSLVNLAFARGRYPRIEYICMDGTWHRKTREELIAAIEKSHTPQNPEEAQALDAFLTAHLIYNEAKDAYELDYARPDKWAYIEWSMCS